MTIKIITDSTSYIDPKICQQLGITLLPLSVYFNDGISFLDDPANSNAFFAKLRKHTTLPTSSQPPQGLLYYTFKEILEQGNEIISIFLSSRISGTFASAVAVKSMLEAEYPQAQIAVLDSRTTAMAMGLIAIAGAQANQSGKPFAEILQTMQSLIARVHFYFIPQTLENLQKGGRIGPAAAFLGSILNIRPVLYVNNGVVDAFKKCHGTNGAINEMMATARHWAQTKNGISNISIAHIQMPERAQEIAAESRKIFAQEVSIVSIGPVLGTHVGEGAVGMAFSTNEP